MDQQIVPSRSSYVIFNGVKVSERVKGYAPPPPLLSFLSLTGFLSGWLFSWLSSSSDDES